MYFPECVSAGKKSRSLFFLKQSSFVTLFIVSQLKLKSTGEEKVNRKLSGIRTHGWTRTDTDELGVDWHPQPKQFIRRFRRLPNFEILRYQLFLNSE